MQSTRLAKGETGGQFSVDTVPDLQNISCLQHAVTAIMEIIRVRAMHKKQYGGGDLGSGWTVEVSQCRLQALSVLYTVIIDILIVCRCDVKVSRCFGHTHLSDLSATDTASRRKHMVLNVAPHNAQQIGFSHRQLERLAASEARSVGTLGSSLDRRETGLTGAFGIAYRYRCNGKERQR